MVEFVDKAASVMKIFPGKNQDAQEMPLGIVALVMGVLAAAFGQKFWKTASVLWPF
jgi:hypothetical protein